jgi:hypothetical protein
MCGLPELPRSGSTALWSPHFWTLARLRIASSAGLDWRASIWTDLGNDIITHVEENPSRIETNGLIDRPVAGVTRGS